MLFMTNSLLFIRIVVVVQHAITSFLDRDYYKWQAPHATAFQILQVDYRPFLLLHSHSRKCFYSAMIAICGSFAMQHAECHGWLRATDRQGPT